MENKLNTQSSSFIMAILFAMLMSQEYLRAQTIIGTTSVQAGTTHTYQISGQATNVSWSAALGATILYSDNYSAQIRWDTPNGNYYVSATFNEGPGYAYLNVQVSGGLPSKPGNPYISSNGCGQVTLTRSGSPPSGITWYWQTSASGTSTSNSGSTYTVGSTGTYYIRARDNSTGGWSETSGFLNVSSITQLNAGSISGANTICYNGNPSALSNSSSASGSSGSYNYQWQYSSTGSSGWTNISGATSNSYDPPSGLTESRWYRRQVSCGNQTVYTGSVKVTVYGNLSAGSVNGVQTICYGGNPSILGNSGSPSGGNGSYSYLWQYSPNGSSGWVDIGGATSNTYDPPSGLETSRWYRRRAQSCSQTVYTGSVKVTVYGNLSAGSVNGVQTICYGGNPSILGNSGSPNGGNGSYSYLWQYSTNGSSGWTDIGGATSTSYDPPGGLTSSRWYRRKVVSCGQTQYTGSVKVTVNTALTAGSISGVQTICYNGDPSILNSASLPANGIGGYSYQWEYSATGSSGWASISGATSTSYDPPGGLTSSGWYRRKVVSCGQTQYTGSVKVTVNTALTAGSISGVQTICYNGDPSILNSASLPANGIGGYSYQWEYSATGSSGWANISGATSTSYDPPGGLTSSGWYRRKVVSCGQTQYTGSVKVTVNTVLTAGSISGVQTICYNGDPSILNSASLPVNGIGGYSYQWEFSTNGSSGWANISGATSTSYDPPSGLTSSRWYRRKVVSCGQTQYTVSVKVTMDPGPLWYADMDNDGFGNSNSSINACTQPSGYVNNGDDYDDATNTITNVAPQYFYSDIDGDGFGDPNVSIYQSFAPMGYTSNNSDACPNGYGMNNGCDFDPISLSDKNYIHSRSYQSPMSSNTEINENSDVIEDVTYFDGLGRPIQQLGIRASGVRRPSRAQTNISEWTMDWEEGTGGTAFYNQNGQTSENTRVEGIGPFRQNSLLWQCGNDTANDADGGWNTDYFEIDKTAVYRYTVWVKRTGSQDGTTYHGTQNVDNLGGGVNSNPYFWYGDLPNLDQWYLLVGVVHPYGYSGGDTGISGVYDQQGNKVLDGTEFSWSSDTLISRFRSYLYYSTETSVRQYFFNPVLQKIDGSETGINEIIGVGTLTPPRDLITHIGYDGYGRQDKDWLTYMEPSGSVGTYRGDVSSNTRQYHQANFGGDFSGMATGEVNAYSQKEFEPSPLNRVMEQSGPGKDWSLGNGHEIRFDYESNGTNEVRRFDVTLSFLDNTYTPTLSPNGHFGANELYKNVTRDENHDGSASKLHTMEEFTDKQGRVVLKRNYADMDIDNSGSIDPGETEIPHDTYFVYDDFGNLTYVIPPKVDVSDGVSVTELNELCYQYVYDHRDRLVEKQLPGKGREYIIYNKLDMPIMTQDANLRSQDKWLFTLYDAFGRVAYTGVDFGNNMDRIAVQQASDGTIGQYVTKTNTPTTYAGTAVYYSKDAYPVSFDEVLTINYYDGYTFDLDGIVLPTGNIYGQAISTNVKGLFTGSKVRVLNTNDWITTVVMYDTKGRVIYTANKNDYLNTTDIIEIWIDFRGKVLETTTTHKKTGETDIVVVESFTYDHMGRPIQQLQSINGATVELLAENNYDDLGNLVSKGIGGTVDQSRLQTVDYTYNVRGWLRQINDPDNLGSDIFGFKINYNTVGHNATPLYNGNISETEWRTLNSDNSLKWYRYVYDSLNRLINAQNWNNSYNLSYVTYDKNGNIETLKRHGWQDSANYWDMDVLAYDYDNGNKLLNVMDTGNIAYGFIDGTNTNDDFGYDTNGNMISDANKGITSITYNHLNLPEHISINGGGNIGAINYIYDATGAKLQKNVLKNGETNPIITDYVGNYVYENGSLKQISHSEGYIEPDGTDWQFVYYLKDHQNNVRITFTDDNGNGNIETGSSYSEIRREQNYYPFGLEHKGYNNIFYGVKNNLKTFQDQEFTEDLGINIHEWKYRMSDPTIGRFWSIDPLADEYSYQSPYNFSENRVIDGVELEGLEYVPINGNGIAREFNNDVKTAGKAISSFFNRIGASISNILEPKDGFILTGGPGDGIKKSISDMKDRKAPGDAESFDVSSFVGLSDAFGPEFEGLSEGVRLVTELMKEFAPTLLNEDDSTDRFTESSTSNEEVSSSAEKEVTSTTYFRHGTKVIKKFNSTGSAQTDSTNTVNSEDKMRRGQVVDSVIINY